MLLQIAVFTLVSLFSPLVGLLLAVPFTGYIAGLSGKSKRFPTSNQVGSNLLKIFTLHLLLLLILVIIGFISILAAFEILVAVGLTATLFNYFIHKTKDYMYSLLGAAVPGFLYIILKNIFLFDLIKQEVEQANEMFFSSMQNVISPEMMESMQQTMDIMSSVLIEGNAAIWMFSIVAGLAIGALIFSKKSNLLKWDFGLVQFPFYLQFLVALALILFIIEMRTYSLNLLVICSYFYLLQGYSVLFFYVRPTLAKKKILGIGILIIPIFSYFLLITLALIGLVDNWLNFRKFAIHKGES
ncbi:MAG: hypothetical protein KGY75_04100 [Candidatus Cloacimonetes bacterium]|nr:hypothetical protein [Candidatus Cloacimonadota bacterium]MBS3767292.1 hypothetical protein [Candidatus Cloacimonadota bacterium]